MVYEEIALRPVKSVKCSAGCGRRLRRTKKLWQTLNPWNKNDEGAPKTRREIQDELRAEAEVWQAQPEVCLHCGGGA